MTDKKEKLVTNKDLSDDFHQLDEMEAKMKKNKNNKDELLKDFVEEFSFDENDIDNNFL